MARPIRLWLPAEIRSATGRGSQLTRLVLIVVLTLAAAPLLAQSGRLLATGGATTIEGSAGGGIVPWAVLSSLATEDEFGVAAFYTVVDSGDYTLHSTGASATYANRVELSAARQTLKLGTLALLLDQPGAQLEQNIFAAKVRLIGDAVYSKIPQISAGIQYKQNLDSALPLAVGAADDSGIDVYASATKVFIGGLAGRNAVATVTVRGTKANQLGLLGFGGDRDDGYSLQPEISAGVFLSPQVIIGAEYRAKPDNLAFAREDDWSDVFIGYFPNKALAIVVAHARLGSIAGIPQQDGFYFSVQGTF